MKKRLILLALMLFAAFGFVACNTTTTIPTGTGSGQADVPTNLAISGTVLSWDAVSGVTQYIIYIDGVESATVSTTSYDFSSKIGSNTSLTFRVVAKGGAGVEDSDMSVSVAYVANPAQEISEIEDAIATNEYLSGAPEGFAAELVRKGVVSDDFTADMTALDTFMAAVEAANGNVVAINAALSAFIAAVPHYEAYISAFVVVLPQGIDEQIANLNDDIAYWEQEKTDPYTWYTEEECQAYIDEDQASIDRLTDLKATLEANSDDVTLVLTRLLDYLINIQSNLTVTLLNNIQTQINGDDRPTAAEIVAIKDEAVNILLDNLPAAADLEFAYDVLLTFEAAIVGSPLPVAGMTTEMAATSLLGMELELRFLLSLDATFIDGVFAAIDDSRSGNEAQVEIAILVLKKVAAFQTAQATLITQMENTFTEAQKEDLFDSFIDSIPELAAAQGAPQDEINAIVAGLSDVTYAMVTAAADVFDAQGQKILDYLVASDGEVLRLIATAANFESDWDYDQYYNYVYFYLNNYTNTEYDNETRFEIAKMLAVAAAVGGVFEALDPTLATLTEADVTAIVNLVAAALPTALLANGDFTEADVITLVNAMKTAISTQDANVLTLFGDLVDYVNTEDLTADFAALVTELDTWYVAQYGTDWMNAESVDESRMMYAYAIFAAHNLTAFVTSGRRALIDGIVDQAFTFMSTAEFLEANNLTIDDVNAMQTEVEGMIDDVLAQCAVIAAYDYKTLTTDQQTQVQNLFDLFNPA